MKKIFWKIFYSRWLFWIAMAALFYSLISTIYENWIAKSSSPTEKLTALIFSIIYILGKHEGTLRELRGEVRELRGRVDEILRRLPSPAG